MPNTLTPEDRAAIEAAADVLKRFCVGPVQSASIGFICGGSSSGFFTTGVSDRYRAYGTDGYAKRPADVAGKMNLVLCKLHAANPDAEARKALRLAELRDELSRLEGEQA
jgi:hypothetical protein